MWLSLIALFFIPTLATAQQNAVERCRFKPIEMSFILDASASIPRKNFDKIKKFVVDFLEVFDVGNMTRVAVVTYAEGIYQKDSIQLDSHQTKDEVVQAITDIPYRGGQETQTWAALEYLRNVQMAPNKVRKGAKLVTIVITDGNSQKKDRTFDEAKKVRAAGIDTFCVGIGDENQVKPEELLHIAGAAGRTERVEDTNSLDRIRSALAIKTCTTCYATPIDLALILDSSLSITKPHFIRIKHFVMKFLDQFDIGPGINEVRVAVCSFAAGVYKKDSFMLDQYQTKKDVIHAVKTLRYHRGLWTKTGEALRYMRTVQMTPEVTRTFARKVSIVITDGNSSRWETTLEESVLTRDANIITFAVGIGDEHQVKQIELVRIAGDPNRVFRVEDANSLSTIKNGLGQKTCKANGPWKT